MSGRIGRASAWLAVAGALAWLLPGATVLGVVLAAQADAAPGSGCGAGGDSTAVRGVDLDAEQLANAQTIVATTQQTRLAPRAAVIAVATAMRESSLRNLDHGDVAGPDSRGLFQQRMRYYGPTTPTDPAAATIAFLTRLVRVPGWQIMPLTQAAAQVQRPRADLRGAYAQWEPLASDLVQKYWPSSTSSTGPTSPTGSASSGAVSGAVALPCGGDGGEGLDGAPGAAGGSGVPAGYVLPSAGQGRTAVTYALAQLGKPYVWGGVGPRGYDCSGLMLKAWAAAGVALPRTAAQQSTFGVAIATTSQLQPGDLIFIAGSHGSARNPGHVGMFIGSVRGVPYLVQAPQTGRNVEVDPLTRWNKLIVGLRRPVDTR